MTRTIFIHLAFGIAINVAAYLAIAFVQWNLLWSADLSRYSEDGRLQMLVGGCSLNFITHWLVVYIRLRISL
jgi:hypothetical protein